jgi:hypothetical protein
MRRRGLSPSRGTSSRCSKSSYPSDKTRFFRWETVSLVSLVYFVYEVLLGEMRGNTKKVGLTTMVALAVFGLKGMI